MMDIDFKLKQFQEFENFPIKKKKKILRNGDSIKNVSPKKFWIRIILERQLHKFNQKNSIDTKFLYARRHGFESPSSTTCQKAF